MHNARLVRQFEDHCLQEEGGVSREVAECIIKIAEFGRITESRQLEFSRLRTGTKSAANPDGNLGIICLMAPYMHRGDLPELLRIVASPSESRDRVYNAANWLANSCRRYLRGEIYAEAAARRAEEEAKKAEAEKSSAPKSGTRVSPSSAPPAEQPAMATAG